MSLLVRIGHQFERVSWGVLRRLIPRLPISLLRNIGTLMASSRAIEPFPGYRFAIEERHPTPRLVARQKLWNYFKALKVQEPVRIRWVRGLRLDLMLGNDQSRCLFVCGSFEPNEFAFLHTALARSAVFIDIGANEGFYTVFAASLVGELGRVIAVEPSPREYERLSRNVAINHLSNVTLVRCGLGARRGNALLHIADPEHNGQNTLGGFGHTGVTAVEHVQIELSDLDSLIQELALGRVDLIKMDVEGAEFEVIKGGLKTLERYKPTLLIELFEDALSKQGSSAEAVLSQLTQLGYSMYAFSELTGLPEPLKNLEPSSQNIIAVHSSRSQP